MDVPTAIRNLLAVIHGDGGYYTEKHGILQSISDAEDKYINLVMELDSVNYWLEKRETIENITRHYGGDVWNIEGAEFSWKS